MDVSSALVAAWTRWQRLHELHRGRIELGIAEAEAQFELVATGLVVSNDQVQQLFGDNGKVVTSLLTPLPTLESDEEICRRCHFTLVAVGVLLDQFLQSSEAPEGQKEGQGERLIRGSLTTNILLPVLQLDRHAALHHAALSMIQRLLQLTTKREDCQEIIKQLFVQVKVLLTQETEETVSYDSVCRLLEVLLRQDGELVEKFMEICEQATRSCSQQPKFLRAVVLYVVPALLEKDEVEMHQRLLGMVVNAAESLQTSNVATFPQELLYLVCIIMPKAPLKLIADVKLQKLVCFALRHNDSSLRKQGLHILKVAFSHCALLDQPHKSKTKHGFTWVDTWQNFLTASEVIQMHHEQHLIEQVWPQVEDLLAKYLIVQVNSEVDQKNEQWPVQLTFDWMQSLLVRLFAHDNPVVKRLFISNFMESCIGAWQTWEKQRIASNSVEREVSFACDPAFRHFVLRHMLRACNDPVLYKHAHRARFQAHVADFLASFLAFQLAESDKDHVLDVFVAAMEEAIFGEGAENHSPEALLSMLQVFQSPSLKRAASSASAKLLLSASAVDRLRFLLDVHAMQSFSQAMRTKMLRALSHALTGGFVNVSTLSLSLLSRVLCVFPAGALMANGGEAFVQFLVWMKDPSSSSVLVSLSTALKTYLKLQGGGTSENVLSPSQLTRLLLFTAEMAVESGAHHLEEMPGPEAKVDVVLRSPLRYLLSTVSEREMDSARLVLLVAKIEEQAQDLVGSSSLQNFTFSFQRDTFYDGQVSCSYLFACATAVVRRWLDKVPDAPGDYDVESDDHEREDLMEHVSSAVFVLSQMSSHIMNSTGELDQIDELDALCDGLKNVLTTTASRSVFDLALAAKCLSVVGANAAAVDSLCAFESERILPLLLALDTSRRYSGKLDARCAINLAASKWVLLHHVVEASSFIDTNLLRTTYGACIEALPTAGMDPSALINMVNVLSLTLSQLAGGLVKASDGMDQFEGLLEEVWTAYCDSKAKPDALTRAVVVCMFQPVFLLRAELNATMKRWIEEFIRFGSQHRPNVIFHLACRLCQTWRAHPASALSFVDELIELLLYKEPLIDEKEQLTMDTGTPFQGFQGFSPINDSQVAAITSHAKDRFVRLVILSFLDDVAVDTSAAAAGTRELMNALLGRLIALNVTPDWQKQHMLNSDGFGKKLRSWQALCIVSTHATKSQLTDLLPTLQIAFAVPQLPSVRYYMELFGMRMATKFPREICSGVLLPMLRNANLMPQVGASMLLVSAYLANSKLDDKSVDIDCGELLETMLPWLNTSHGYTRVLAQYLLAKVLPRHVHQLQLCSSDTPGLRFLEGTARYLSNNKECKRMLRRQARQLEEFHPDYESSLLGMLSSGFISEFGELLPREEALRFSEQLKNAMNELYAQYQLENFTPAPTQGMSDAASPAENEPASGTLTVQRKIDTTALLLDDSALPAAMRVNFDAARRGDTLNARQRPRQPLIMCASLVDKIPNLAGLARTCEIFNAQKLIVPNLRTAEKDATFATVSATAHKWMPLEEVRPQGSDLRDALLRWKGEGYTIVAVEQTASSVSLANYTLPRKMVLVLGREKEGIPVDVLQLVDVCVEIPQFGLVRSLNVHVSGALMLWEYTQQQLMSGALESTL